MKDLVKVLFSEISTKKNYVVGVAGENKYGDRYLDTKVGSGKEVISMLKEFFNYGDGSNYSTLDEFFDECEVVNGEGDEFIEVFEL